jgi:hypothetical protein
MRNILRFCALIIALVSAVFWFFGGPNLGWTKTSVPIQKFDPVTEQSYPQWEKRFVPGVDFLAASFASAAVLAGISCFFRSKA